MKINNYQIYQYANSLQSLFDNKDLYITGELLDVDGECGGYNLTFAWISGMLAGKSCNQ